MVDKLKLIKLEDDEVLISFDIKSYFPSVPIEKAMLALQQWLDKQNLHHMKKEAFFELTKICMNQSYFQFRGDYYHQFDGTAMGNPLSPFVCNVFINSFEIELSKNDFPRVWLRYVDDVFSIVKKNKVEEVLNLINGICENIQFTTELENNGVLNYLC